MQPSPIHRFRIWNISWLFDHFWSRAVMVRPCASEENKKLAMLFARTVGPSCHAEQGLSCRVCTTTCRCADSRINRPFLISRCQGAPCAKGHLLSDSCGISSLLQVSAEGTGVIARTGSWGIFSALRACCPSAIRSDDPFIGRHGLTEIEHNKVGPWLHYRGVVSCSPRP